MAIDNTTLLVVDDDIVTCRILATHFTRENVAVTSCYTGASARLELAIKKFSAVLLEVGIDDGRGFDLISEIRANYETLPILVVTDYTEESDLVYCLSLGADDFIAKPFSLPELSARFHAVMRRSNPQQTGSMNWATGTVGDVNFDIMRREFTDQLGTLLPLTRGESDLLSALVSFRGSTVSRDYLLDVISANSIEVTERSVDTLICRLRRKLKAKTDDRLRIETVRGVGYRLVEWSNMPITQEIRAI